MDPEVAVQNLIDSCDKPLIGLEHVEYLSSQKLLGRKGVGYKCNLCISTGMSEVDIISHVTGLTHRLAYLKKNHLDLYQSCMEGIHYDTKNLPFRVENLANLVEGNFGRKRVYFSFGARREIKELYQNPDSSNYGQSWESQLSQQAQSREQQQVAQGEWLRNVLVLGQPVDHSATNIGGGYDGSGSRDSDPKTSYEVVANAARQWAAVVQENNVGIHPPLNSSTGNTVGDLRIDVGGGHGPNTHPIKNHSNSQAPSDNNKVDNVVTQSRCIDTKKMKRNSSDLYVICFDNDGTYKPQDAPNIAKKYSSCRHLSSVTISKKTISLKFSDRESAKNALRQSRGSSHVMYIHPDCIHREHRKESKRDKERPLVESMSNHPYTSATLSQHNPSLASQTTMLQQSTMNAFAPTQSTGLNPPKTMALRYSEICYKQVDFLKEFRSYLMCLRSAKHSSDLSRPILFPEFDIDRIDKLKEFIEDILKREQERAT